MIVKLMSRLLSSYNHQFYKYQGKYFCQLHQQEMLYKATARSGGQSCDCCGNSVGRMNNQENWHCLRCSGGGMDICKTCIENPATYME